MSLLVKLECFDGILCFSQNFLEPHYVMDSWLYGPLSLSYSMEQLSAYGDRDQPAPRADQESRKDKTANMSVSLPPDSSEDGDMAPPTSVPAGPTGPVTCDPELSIPASFPVLPGSQGPVGVHPVPPPPDEPYEMYLCRIERHKTDSTSFGPATCHCGTASGTGNATYSPPTVIPHLRGTSPRSKGSIFYSSHAHAASRTLLSAISSTLVLARTGSCRSGPQPAPVPAGSCTSGRWAAVAPSSALWASHLCLILSSWPRFRRFKHHCRTLPRLAGVFLAKSRIAPRTSRTCRCSVPVKPDFWTFDNPTSCLNTCLCLHLPSLLSRPFRPLHPWWLLLRLCRPWCKTGKTPSSSPWRPNGRQWWVMLHPSRLRVPLFCAIWTPAGCGSWVPLMTERHHRLRFSLVQRERTVALGSGAPLGDGSEASRDGRFHLRQLRDSSASLSSSHRPSPPSKRLRADSCSPTYRSCSQDNCWRSIGSCCHRASPSHASCHSRSQTSHSQRRSSRDHSALSRHPSPAGMTRRLAGTYPCHPGAVPPRRCSDHPETIVCPLAPGGCTPNRRGRYSSLGHLH